MQIQHFLSLFVKYVNKLTDKRRYLHESPNHVCYRYMNTEAASIFKALMIWHAIAANAQNVMILDVSNALRPSMPDDEEPIC